VNKTKRIESLEAEVTRLTEKVARLEAPQIGTRLHQSLEEYALIPNGTYDAVIVDVELKKSRKGWSYWSVKYQLPYYNGRYIWTQYKARLEAPIEKVARTLGVELDPVENVQYGYPEPYTLVGKLCRVVVGSETFESPYGARNMIRDVLPR
jgi:hypothetical protein